MKIIYFHVHFNSGCYGFDAIVREAEHGYGIDDIKK